MVVSLIWLLAVRGSIVTVEIVLVFFVVRDHFLVGVEVCNGGIVNLVGGVPVEGLGDGGVADFVIYVEIQVLCYLVEYFGIWIILMVIEGFYCIVAWCSVGIVDIVDLRGKCIVVIFTIFLGYFLVRMLA